MITLTEAGAMFITRDNEVTLILPGAFITRDSEMIMFSPGVFIDVCVCGCVCVFVKMFVQTT